jgi:cob(I)alamin adenosyltransferase
MILFTTINLKSKINNHIIYKMKVYTKTERKEPQPFCGTRVPKDHARIESYGTVDELNSHIGLIRDQEMNAHYKEILIEIQDRLFTVVILATPPEKKSRKTANCVKKTGHYRI